MGSLNTRIIGGKKAWLTTYRHYGERSKGVFAPYLGSTWTIRIEGHGIVAKGESKDDLTAGHDADDEMSRLQKEYRKTKQLPPVLDEPTS